MNVWEYILFALNLSDSETLSENIPLSIGFYFSPPHHVLLVYYLAKKILGLDPPPLFIKHIDDLYKCEPHQFPIDEFTMGIEGEGYFYTTREPNEAEMFVTNNGYWKKVAEDEEDEDYEPEMIEYEDYLIGFKKTYIFYQGNAESGVETQWVLREYQFNPFLLPTSLLTDDLKAQMDTMVVCKIKDKGHEKRRPI